MHSAREWYARKLPDDNRLSKDSFHMHVDDNTIVALGHCFKSGK